MAFLPEFHTPSFQAPPCKICKDKISQAEKTRGGSGEEQQRL